MKVRSVLETAVLPAASSLHDGRFAIMRCLGKGSLGATYEAYDAERNELVALKMLTHCDADWLAAIEREFRAFVKVTHPNLVSLHQLIMDLDGWFFTMELVDGVRFDEWVRRKGETSCDEARLREALDQLVAAVSMIHAVGKLHCDLKPNNVLVTEDRRLVVLDAGLVADPEPGAGPYLATPTRVVGTPSYLAPEQAAGDPATESSDYYALGVMLFQGLTGALPFSGSISQVLTNKQRQEAPAPSSFVQNGPLPADLESACSRLLARDPRVRARAFDRLARSATVRQSGFRRKRDEGRSSTPTSGMPGQPRLYGRDEELRELHAAYEVSRTGDRPAIVLLAGEGGMGKSALADAFVRPLRADGRALVLSAQCYEHESGPYKAFDAIVEELAGELQRLSDEEVGSILPRDGAALKTLFPALGQILALAPPSPPESAEPQQLRLRAFGAFGELLSRLCDRRPVVLHLDDLQWSDPDSTALLMHIVRRPDAPRLLIIAAHRSEELRNHPCLRPLYDTLALDPRLDVRSLQLRALDDEAVADLLRDQWIELARPVVEGAAGNPLLLRELVHHARRYPGVLAKPVSLNALLSSRLSSLTDAERHVLELLIVAKRPIELGLLAKAACIAGGTRTIFDRLRGEHLARMTGEGSLVECFHDRIREALAQSLPATVVQAHHASLAEAFMTLTDPDP